MILRLLLVVRYQDRKMRRSLETEATEGVRQFLFVTMRSNLITDGCSS